MIVQTDLLEHCSRAFLSLCCRHALYLHDKTDVFFCGEYGDQVIGLKDKADGVQTELGEGVA